MSEKTWGGEPFWGLGYEWDPDWVLTERQKELRAKLIELCESEMRANAKRSDDELLYPRRNFEILAENGFLEPDRARGVRRHGREPRRLLDGLRDARPLRLRLDRDVLRDAHRRGGDDHAAPDRGAGRQVHPHARLGVPDRDPLLLRPRDRLALLVPVLLQRRALQRRLQGQQEGLLDHLRRVRRLLRRPDDEPRLQRLRRPLGVRHRRRRRPGPAVALGRARAARQPVRPDRGRRRRDPRRAGRRAARRRRRLQRRGRRPLVPDRLLVGLERHRAGGDRHRQAPHDAQAPRRRRHARRRLPDDPGLRRRGGDGHQRLPRLRLLGRPGDGPGHRRQHQADPGPARPPAPTTCTGPGRSSSRRPRTSPTSSTRCCTPAAGPGTSATWSWSATSATPRPAG